jgi:hypothetical protein
MSDRSPEQIRKEIAAERAGLDHDLGQLRSEVRSLVPFVAAGVAVIGLVTFRKGTASGVRLLLKLI